MDSMVTINLSSGAMALVDDQDADLAGLPWYASVFGKTSYALRNVRKPGGAKTTERLHRVIAARMGLKGEVDHRDHNGLNNTRENLRSATRSQNNANQTMRRDNTSGVKGVTWDKTRRQWQAGMKVNGRYRLVGRFDDLAAAKKSVEAAREQVFGAYACHGTNEQ